MELYICGCINCSNINIFKNIYQPNWNRKSHVFNMSVVIVGVIGNSLCLLRPTPGVSSMTLLASVNSVSSVNMIGKLPRMSNRNIV